MKKRLKCIRFTLVALGFSTLVSTVRAEYTDDCIIFSSTASFTLKTNNTSKNWDGALWTSTDKINWTEWSGMEVKAAQKGDAYNLYVRGNTSNTKITGMYTSGWWVLTGSADIDCSGNIETLRGATGDAPSPTPMAKYCYNNLFYCCYKLTSAPALPATALSDYCYKGMFYCCYSLKIAPALPATTLADSCYYYMFYNCLKLTIAPVLPATALADWCYCYMFGGCSSLGTAPELPAMTMKVACYEAMFHDCTALLEAPALPATTLAGNCYDSMFNRCTSLTAVPELPATKLAAYCYLGMFKNCFALKMNSAAPGKAWKIPATTGAADWGLQMFDYTAGDLKGQPALNTTYYIASAPMPGSKADPWQIGASADDDVIAWTNGVGKLIVEGVGNMKEFAADGSDIPWPTAEISAVEISVDVTGVGYNAWYGLDDSATYNGLSIGAAKTLINGFRCKLGFLMMIK